MTDIVVATETDTISDIQEYLYDNNDDNNAGKNDSNENDAVDENETTAAATTVTDENDENTDTEQSEATANQVLYTIDGKEIAGNIVLTDQDGQSEQSGNFQTFMVMNNDQQYMLIMEPESGATDEEQALVVTANDDGQETTNGDDDTNQPEEMTSNVEETPAKRTRGAFRKNQKIKEELMDDDGQNDISVYDFNDQPNRAATSQGTSATSSSKNQSAFEDDVDFKTPVKRGRPAKSADSSKSKVKSGSSSLALNTTSGSSSSNVHVCTYCTYTSTKRYLLSRHLKSHSEDRPHKCGICERGFKTLASLHNHVNTHTGVRPHQCKFCDAAFTTSGELVRHIRYRHTHEKPHRCTECDYASVELSKLKRHMRCHTGERPYQCPHCTYASPDTYKLKRHLRIHTGEKPYLCDVCHQRFTQSNSLKAHKLIHTGNKPVFKCEFCPTTCGRKTDLRIHVQKLHTSDKMLTCKRCDQSFPDRYQFKMHLKTHEGEKCFKCDLCKYASVSARHLESHMLIHTDQKPYICEVCQLSFRQKQLLKRHKNLYHNPTYVPPVPKEKTHECAHCSKAFRHKGNLIRHMAHHDPDNKNNNSKDVEILNNSQLIDDEYYEDEDDYEMSEDPTQVSIVTADSSGAIIDSSTAGDGSIQITLDQQLIDSNNDQVMLLLVSQDGDTSSNGQITADAASNSNATAATPRIISRSARVTRNSTKTNDVQVLYDDSKSLLNSENGETSLTTDAPSQLSFDNSDTMNYEEQLQKQKDLDSCFGFKDEDDEDEIILSMPAVHGQ